MKDLKLENSDVVKVSKRGAKRWLYLLALVLLTGFALVWGVKAASEPIPAPESPSTPSSEAQNRAVANNPDPCGLDGVVCPDEQPGYAKEPQADPSIPNTIYATVFTYQADIAQTDGDECTTADGTDICPLPAFGVVANNCLDFGTKVQIGDNSYFVHDRMNARYGCDVFDVLTNGINFKLINEPVVVL